MGKLTRCDRFKQKLTELAYDKLKKSIQKESKKVKKRIFKENDQILKVRSEKIKFTSLKTTNKKLEK